MTQLALSGLEIKDYHDFVERLTYANANSQTKRLETFYKACFPNVVEIKKVTNLALQKQGIDTAVTLANGKTVYFDEKIRSEDYGDILLEEYSVWPFHDWERYEEYKEAGILPIGSRHNGLETVHVESKKPVPEGYEKLLVKGWINGNKLTDYISYVIKPSRKVYFLPFLLLQRAWDKYYLQWLNSHGRRLARNRTYITTNISVPTETLYKALFEAAEY